MDTIDKKFKIIISVVCSTVLLTGGLVAQNALASSGVISTPSILSKVVGKFHPKQSMAKKANQQKEETPTVALEDLRNLLSESVKNGTITSAQEVLILNKEISIEQQVSTIVLTNRNTNTRQTAINQLIVQTQLWATENGISTTFITEFLNKIYALM